MSSPNAPSGFGRGLIAGAIITVLLLTLIGPLRDAVLPEDEADNRINEALGLIERSYFREVDPDELQDASVEGAIRRLRRENDDQFSHYFDPETYERFLSSTSGQFSGIGVTVTEVKRGLRVANVFEETPAQEEGIEAGDVIVSVEGEKIAGEDSTEVASQIKGPPGTEVRIGVRDADSGRTEQLTIERADVRIPAVSGEIREQGGKEIAYVQLATFSRGAHGELRSEIKQLYRQGAEGLVLDIRGNGGGLLQEAVLIGSIFLDEGPIVRTDGRTRDQRTFDANGSALDAKPTALLINNDSASASEILAAVLKQNDLATLVGTKTFGKGTFQEVIELDNGGAVDITVGEYLTADGTSILGTGVKPDIRVELDADTAEDEVLERGLEVVTEQINEG